MATQTVIQEARLPKFQEDFLANIFKSAKNLADDGTMLQHLVVLDLFNLFCNKEHKPLDKALDS